MLINSAFTQSVTGTMQIMIDHHSGLSESFNILGAAQLDGTLAIGTLSAGSVRPGTFRRAETVSLASQGLTLSAVKSAILSYALSTAGGVLSLISTANFALDGLSQIYAEIPLFSPFQ